MTDPTPSVLDLLHDAATERTRVVVEGETPVHVSFASIWSQAERAADWYAARLSPGEAIGLVLSTSVESIAALVGGWLAGLTVASFPHRARALDEEAYASQLDVLADLVDARLLLMDDSFDHLPSGRPVHRLAAPSAGGARSSRPGSGRFIQFSSGSTGNPKGVALGLGAIAANVRAIIETFGPAERFATCSWLPLSHDMGLVGMCLATLASCGPRWYGEGQVVLLAPESFVRSPSRWLRACDEHRTTLTCAPNVAFDLLARRPPPPGSLRLDSIETCIVGSEPVRARSLRAFADAMAGAGFDPLAFCPAYGMAEASLAVAATRRAEPWSARSVDATALADGRVVSSMGEHRTELVSVGTPLPGMEVRIAEGDAAEPERAEAVVGEIEVRGRSMMDGYVGSARPGVNRDGWYRTGDLGCVVDGSLYVTGRTDDLLFVGGRNVYATEVEEALRGVRGLRPDNCAVVADDDGRYVVIAERRGGARVRESLPEVCRSLRKASIDAAGAAPSRIVILAPGGFPKTPSGKVQRTLLQASLRRNELPVDHQLDLRLS